MAGAEYPAGQLFYQLALSKADRPFVDDYQLYKNPVDFQADPLKYGADTFADWVKKGYIAKDSAASRPRTWAPAFIGGKCADDRLRQLVVRPVQRRDQGLRLGHLPVPRQQAERRLLRQPVGRPDAVARTRTWPTTSSTSRCSPEIQDLLGNNGGIPVAADPATITDPKNQELIANFNTITKQRRSGVLPGLAGARLLRRAGRRVPVPDQRVQDPDQVLDTIAKPYAEGVKEITGK